MATGEPSPNEHWQGQRVFRWIMLAITVCSWATLTLVATSSGSSKSDAASLMVTFGVAFGSLALTAVLFRRDETSGQAETYARVREAEQELEDALRGPASSRRFILVPDDDPRLDAANSDPPAVSPPSAGTSRELDQQQTRLTLSELWAVTHRRLDHYHGIALGQAKQSFLNAQIAMGIGFILLIGFAAVAWNASTATGSVVAGGLGAVSAALAGYVSRTFIRSQEAAAGHLRAYFDQPLEFSRYLAAERLMADAGLSDERRAEVLALLVQAMITGPSPQTPIGASEQQPGNAAAWPSRP
ncbi:hypothetical protein [Streptomyces sp. FXY-T5]|uniref:hypothetical protein n=1 Tax=Streptomyces sp. FXY-T5 TaxID=3064901 RepID=UPI0027D2C326|nr:hypothetical protein [Streptomyces sp. FXY-T5]WMD09755.1 hypothetical protein Q7C01_37800 [Streptomyces sp. FXY-T5]